jgi:hypothetical protein
MVKAYEESIRRNFDGKSIFELALDMEFSLVERLISEASEPYMKDVWKALQEREVSLDAAGMWLYMTCVYAYFWPDSKRKTKAEKDKARLAVEKHLREAARLIRDNTELNYKVVGFLPSPECQRVWKEELEREMTVSFSFIHMLEMGADRAKSQVGRPVLTGKPNVPRAHRSVFVRQLSASMKAMYGKPLQEIVVKITNTVFSDEAIDDPIDVKFVQNNSD